MPIEYKSRKLMHYWKELQQLEIEITNLFFLGISPKKKKIDHFREIFSKCETDDDSDMAISYHGSKALLAQFDGKIEIAIRHREIERQKIERLYQLEEENPTGGSSLENYEKNDLAQRKRICYKLRELSSEIE